MNIAMFGQKQTPSPSGGVEAVVGELSTRMAKHGHRVTCYDRGGRKAFWNGVAICPVPTIGKKGLAAVTSSFFAAVFSALADVQVVHIHAEGPAFWCWIPKLTGKRIVVTIHGLDWQREKWKDTLGAYYIRLGERMAVRFADQIIVLSNSARNYFLQAYGRETVWIPNGIAPANPIPAKQIWDRFHLQKEEYLLYLGRLVPEKGIHYLIEAYCGMKTEKKLVIAGSASDTEDYVIRLRKMAEGNAGICFTGFADGQLRAELYSNAWAYILPTDLEGMPLSLLEAMGYGNCCLTSDIPECTEVAGDAAMCFERGNVRQLRERLESICHDRKLVLQYREKARAARRDLFDWENVVKETLELYQ